MWQDLTAVTLATIYKDNQMYAYFNVADNQWLGMAMNDNQSAKNLPQKIMVQLGKDGTESYPAVLDYLSPNVDMSTGTLMVRANFDNPKGLLKRRVVCEYNSSLWRSLKCCIGEGSFYRNGSVR